MGSTTRPNATARTALRGSGCEQRSQPLPALAAPLVEQCPSGLGDVDQGARPSSGSGSLVTSPARSSRWMSWVIEGWLIPSRAARAVSLIGLRGRSG